ncbi:hypothetical protein D6C87_07606 [Aureobasidium pullulans]|uniref:Uncharacterized protein n=1 Tax=Aureobasidium pullulans TaxID=5580 RepID=A0AB38LHD8_AURPU|nr:hypothetical protein D6D27_09449 [Aureobasidium pullulans]THY68263.1 hypothetical protein D6C94_10329 [Aureobasidium pullulans]THZ38739.1 hypothetical protein D6C87_07606 [Aureobasidium pullulans]THZ57841.1 hypothetical protein D6C88_09083 [Aureobasidium pullulans]
MKSTIAALAFIASTVSAQSANLAGLAAIPTGVFHLPVVYATAGGPAITATTLAVSATASSDPSATSLINAAARASLVVSPAQKRDSHHKRDGNCAAQPSGISHNSTPDTPAAFVADPYYAQQAEDAVVPAGYTAMFTNLNASNSANKYMGYTLLPSYDVQSCSNRCSAITGCNSFNIYFERDPSLDPSALDCPNPASTVNVKCVFWGDVVGAINANNFGQWRNSFQVLIAGSNGYVNSSLIAPKTCQKSFPNAGGIQVWNPSNPNNLNSKWMSVGSGNSPSLNLVTGTSGASSNGTSFSNNNIDWLLFNVNGTNCGNALSVSSTNTSPQIATFETVGTAGKVNLGCWVRSWSDFMVTCSNNGRVWTASVCSSDGYTNLYWSPNGVASGCQWVGLYYHVPANPNAPS